MIVSVGSRLYRIGGRRDPAGCEHRLLTAAEEPVSLRCATLRCVECDHEIEVAWLRALTPTEMIDG